MTQADLVHLDHVGRVAACAVTLGAPTRPLGGAHTCDEDARDLVFAGPPDDSGSVAKAGWQLGRVVAEDDDAGVCDRPSRAGGRRWVERDDRLAVTQAKPSVAKPRYFQGAPRRRSASPKPL